MFAEMRLRFDIISETDKSGGTHTNPFPLGSECNGDKGNYRRLRQSTTTRNPVST